MYTGVFSSGRSSVARVTLTTRMSFTRHAEHRRVRTSRTFKSSPNYPDISFAGAVACFPTERQEDGTKADSGSDRKGAPGRPQRAS